MSVSRFLDRHGRDVTLQNYSQNGEDDWGENWTADASQTVKARVVSGAVTDTDRDRLNVADPEMMLDVFVKDSITGITSGGGEGASELTIDSHTYVVLHKDNQDNGLYRLVCERVD